MSFNLSDSLKTSFLLIVAMNVLLTWENNFTIFCVLSECSCKQEYICILKLALILLVDTNLAAIFNFEEEAVCLILAVPTTEDQDFIKSHLESSSWTQSSRHVNSYQFPSLSFCQVKSFDLVAEF